jgi:beta-lactamase class A
VIAAAAMDVASGRLVERDGLRMLPAASTVKVLISVAFWRAVARGELDPARRIAVRDAPVAGGGGLLESLHEGTEPALADLDLLMLAVSDNAATNALLALVGVDAVNGEAARLGLARTVVRRPMADADAAAAGHDNVTCAIDMARLLAALADGRGVPRRWARRTLAALAESHHGWVIPSALPPAGPCGRVVHPKAGELETVRHEIGLVDDGDARTAVAVLSSPPGAPDGLARVAAALYRAVRS